MKSTDTSEMFFIFTIFGVKSYKNVAVTEEHFISLSSREYVNITLVNTLGKKVNPKITFYST